MAGKLCQFTQHWQSVANIILVSFIYYYNFYLFSI